MANEQEEISPGWKKALEDFVSKAAFYVVIDVGKMGDKDEKLARAKNNFNFRGKRPTDIIIIDGKPKQSASKL